MAELSPGQMKKYLKQLRQRQEQYVYYLGQLTYQAGEQGRLEEASMLDAYNTLKDIESQISQWEASLEQYKAAQKPTCPNCGVPVQKGALFCPGCGSSLAAPAPAAAAPAAPPAAVPGKPAGGRTCSNCGAPLDDDAVFCGNCGAKVAQPPAAAEKVEEEPPAPPPEPGATPQPVSPQAAAQLQTAPATAEEALEEISGKGEGEKEEGSPEREENAAEQPVEAEPEEKELVCPGCGKEFSDTSVRFCPDCGTKVQE